MRLNSNKSVVANATVIPAYIPATTIDLFLKYGARDVNTLYGVYFDKSFKKLSETYETQKLIITNKTATRRLFFICRICLYIFIIYNIISKLTIISILSEMS